MKKHYDLIIVGGGAVGSALACALSHSQLSIAVIEAVSPNADSQPSFDDRGLSISLSSKNILQNLGLWEQLVPHSTPISHIHVSDQHHFGFVRLSAEEARVSAMGYVVLARALGQAFHEQINVAENIEFIHPATVSNLNIIDSQVEVEISKGEVLSNITGKLLIAADGTDSQTRKRLGIEATSKDYEQVAIVSNVLPDKPHNNSAYERFTEHGPLALLPHKDNRCVLVFTVAKDDVEKYLQMEEQAFLDVLLKRFGRRLGRFSKLGQRKSYPLKMLEVKDQVLHRAVILGNAAHAVHPNGAQGFNLGLRDAAALAETLMSVDKNEIGDLSTLTTYLESRKEDQQRVLNFTDRLATSFYNKQALKIIARNFAMLATDLSPWLKNEFTKNSMGFVGQQPNMIYQQAESFIK